MVWTHEVSLNSFSLSTIIYNCPLGQKIITLQSRSANWCRTTLEFVQHRLGGSCRAERLCPLSSIPPQLSSLGLSQAEEFSNQWSCRCTSTGFPHSLGTSSYTILASWYGLFAPREHEGGQCFSQKCCQRMKRKRCKESQQNGGI